MKRLIAGLLAIALGLSTIAPLMITDAAFAAPFSHMNTVVP
jgi:hypothetical protein